MLTCYPDPELFVMQTTIPDAYKKNIYDLIMKDATTQTEPEHIK